MHDQDVNTEESKKQTGKVVKSRPSVSCSDEFVVNVSVLDRLEDSLYDMETASNAVSDTLKADLDPEHKELAIQTMAGRLQELVSGSLLILQDAGLLRSTRELPEPKLSEADMAAAIEYARKMGRTAAADWDAEDESLEHCRLRSLMNFERDVVKSTWEDTGAHPQWNAFLEAFDKEVAAKKADGAGESRKYAISMDEARGKRFNWALLWLLDALDSLESMVPLFPPHSGIAKGQIEPSVAVLSTLRGIDPVTSLLLGMANNEEHQDNLAGLPPLLRAENFAPAMKGGE